MDPATQALLTGPAPPRQLSCVKCRSSKLRCMDVPGSNKCVHCSKKDIECVRPESKRVRQSKKPRSFTNTEDSQEAPKETSNPRLPYVSFSPTSSSSSPAGLTPSSDSINHQNQASPSKSKEKAFFPPRTSFQRYPYNFSSERGQDPQVSQTQPQASSSSSTAPEFVDSTEKATDPGLPALSNPLKLLGLYMSSELNASLVLLDPILYPFYSLIKHPTLLTVICLVVSRMKEDEEAAQISERLQTHFEDVLYPAVVLEGHRTTEIAIAFLLYAAYHPNTKSLKEDRTWTYAGHSLRMAIELDLNSRIQSGGLNRQDESMQRLFRNRERTWLNIWLFDQSMSAQAGVRPSLSEAGIISSCIHWHESEFKVPGDGALVAQVQLRRLFTHHKELFERLGLLWHRNDSLPFDSTKLLNIEFYLKTLEDSYANWSSQWLHVEPGTQRGARLKVYSLYSKVFLLSMPIQSFYKNDSVALPIFMKMYECIVAYLEEFVSGRAFPAFKSTQNSSFVHLSYVSIMALKLTTLSAKYSFIDVDQIIQWVSQVVEAFHAVANSTKQRRSPATTYGVSLQKILDDCINYRNHLREQDQRDQLLSSNSAMSLTGPSILNSGSNGHDHQPSNSNSENFQNIFPSFGGEGFFDQFSGDRGALSDAEFLALLNESSDSR